MRRRPVVYIIRNTVNNKVYVGSSVEYKYRWKAHRHELESGRHHSVLLQRSWNKHGSEAFVFEVVAVAERKAVLRKLEQQFIDELKAHNPEFGYNIVADVAKRFEQVRKPVSVETKLKIGVANKGRVTPPELAAQRSTNAKAQMSNPEVRKRISDKLSGRLLSDETRAKMSKSRTGKKHSKPTLSKMSKSLKQAWSNPALREAQSKLMQSKLQKRRENHE